MAKLSKASRARLEEVLERAARDIKFREMLRTSPEAALAGSGLSKAEITLVSTLKRVALEEWGVDIRRFRAFLRDNGNKSSSGTGGGTVRRVVVVKKAAKRISPKKAAKKVAAKKVAAKKVAKRADRK